MRYLLYYSLAILLAAPVLAVLPATPGSTVDSATPVATLPAPSVSATTVKVRVKDIARIQSARDNQLLGYGLVVGLNGTGDSNKSDFTTLALSTMLQKLGVTVPASRLKVKNVAAVMLTAQIGPFLKTGDQLDVAVSSLGDATSLQGGVLLQTPLCGADGNVYAVAQGSVSLGGFSASGGGASMTAGHPTVGRIPSGGLVEREIPTVLAPKNILTLTLHAPDFTTAARLAASVSADLADVGGTASARDAATVDIPVPGAYQQRVVELIARIGDDTLQIDTPAKVVINERTGTVVVTGEVTITPVAVAQGNLAITINPEFFVSQPNWLSREGETVSKESADISVKNPTVNLTMIQGATVEELVRALNAMKATPRDIIAILQALKQAGALQAEITII